MEMQCPYSRSNMIKVIWMTFGMMKLKCFKLCFILFQIEKIDIVWKEILNSYNTIPALSKYSHSHIVSYNKEEMHVHINQQHLLHLDLVSQPVIGWIASEQFYMSHGHVSWRINISCCIHLSWMPQLPEFEHRIFWYLGTHLGTHSAYCATTHH